MALRLAEQLAAKLDSKRAPGDDRREVDGESNPEAEP